MNVGIFTDAVFGVNSYVIEENGHALLIDPVLTEELRAALEAVTVDFALLSHEHYDHIRGVRELRDAYGVRVLCGEHAAAALPEPRVNMSHYTAMLKQFLPFGDGKPVEVDDYVCHADGTLRDGETLEWQGHTLKIHETPGHSAGSICVLLDADALFAGDSVFRDYATATRMPGGSTKRFRSVTEPLLASLPQALTVYPGHAEPFLLAERFRRETQQD